MTRILRCLGAMAGLTLFLGCALAWCCPGTSARLRRRLERKAWSALLGSLGVELECIGTPAPHALYVANHVSWLDIPALALLTGAGFVAKDTVRSWPLIGPLARRYGCLFVDRTRRTDALRQAHAMHDTLRRAQGLVIFPEGTTSDGTDVLLFRTSLFEPVCLLGDVTVQPVAIRFTERDGQPIAPQRRREVAWLGDDALLPHFLQLAARGGVRIEVSFEPPVIPTRRKDTADSCRAALRARLTDSDAMPPAQAESLNRAA